LPTAVLFLTFSFENELFLVRVERMIVLLLFGFFGCDWTKRFQG